jgi:mono/diheme cytochrome c family protein
MARLAVMAFRMMPPVMGRRRRATAAALSVVAVGAVACGSQGISPQIASQPENVRQGARLFSERCSGCHTLDVVGAEGTTLNVRQRERVDGPNFNVRKEQADNVLYAIRNGGYSGAIMPENIVVGREANDVAAFLAKYSGREGSSSFTPEQQTGQ